MSDDDSAQPKRMRFDDDSASEEVCSWPKHASALNRGVLEFETHLLLPPSQDDYDYGSELDSDQFEELSQSSAAGSGSAPQYVVVGLDELSRRADARVAEVQDVLALGHDAARLLLMTVGWDAERAMNALFELKDSLREALENLDDGIPAMPKPKSALPTRRECPICCETCTVDTWVALACGHACCRTCLARYLTGKVEEAKSHRPVTCMQCPALLSNALMETALSPQARAKHSRRTIDSFGVLVTRVCVSGAAGGRNTATQPVASLGPSTNAKVLFFGCDSGRQPVGTVVSVAAGMRAGRRRAGGPCVEYAYRILSICYLAAQAVYVALSPHLFCTW
jgi:hypothetical protein